MIVRTILCAIAVALGYTVTSVSTEAATQAPTFVRGFVVAGLTQELSAEQTRRREVYLPGVEVSLTEAGSTEPSAVDVTDLSGRFTFKSRIPGVYQVCARADGFLPTCLDKPLELDPGKGSIYVGTLRLTPDRREPTATVFGSVALRDGSRPRALQPLLGLNAFAQVALDAGGDVRTVLLNNYGEYVLTGAPTTDPFTLIATVENATLKQQVDQRTGLRPGIAYRFDLTFDNGPPELAPVAAFDSATDRPAETARPGATVTLRMPATDPDGDSVTYRWLVPEGNGTLDATDRSEVQWQLPGITGRYGLTLIASDGRGGYAQHRVPMRVTTGGVRFSGDVTDGGGAAIPRARITVNTRSLRANAFGHFELEVPPADKYVVNIRADGFGPSSRVYTRGITGEAWQLRRAEVITANPGTTIVAQQLERSKADCRGPRSRDIPWEEGGWLQPGILQWQDGRGNALSPAEVAVRERETALEVGGLLTRVDRSLIPLVREVLGVVPDDILPQDVGCGPGIGIEIPAGALVDRAGSPPAGPVRVELATVDLQTPGQMPGDWGAVDPTGDDYVMESFGAGSVEVSAGVAPLNIAPGESATVRIPVDPRQLASGATPPPTMPLLSYDPQRGLWVEEGEMTLANSPTGPVYEAKVSHLSEFNADFRAEPDPACVAVRVGPGLPANFTVEVHLPPKPPSTVAQVRNFPIVTSTGAEHVMYRLPNNTNIVLVPIVSGVRPDGSTGDVPAGIFVVNTGGPQTAAVLPPPGPPYYNEDASGNPLGPCLTRVDLANLTIPDAPDAPYEFLQGLDVQASNLTELDASDPAIAQSVRDASTAYYDLVDPRELRRDLTDFQERNEFGEPLDAAAGELEASAAYANSGDLGFGRNMNCRRNRASDGAFDIACYVTNYGDHLTPDAQDAEDAADQDPTAEVATVAMEYTRVENPPGDPIEFPDNSRTVKFYVYKRAVPSPVDPGEPNGIAISADLDGAGERPVPQLCVVCHGGTYASEPADPADPFGLQKPAFVFRSDVFMGSRFIPFDLHFFADPPAPLTIAAQEPSFRSLNLDFVRLVPEGVLATDPVAELVDALYPPDPVTGDPAAVQDDQAVVPNWDAATPASPDNRFYRDVFARACRSCHVTSPFGSFVMNDKNQFRALISTVQARVCDQHVMPHARRTHDLFWTSLSPNMAGRLQQYGQAIPGWDPTSPDAQCGLSFTPGGNTSVSTFTAEIQPIFTGRCTACHGTAAAFNANLALSAGNAYPNLVSVVSHEHPPTLRLQPGNSNNSYLFRKILGDHASLGAPFVAPGPGDRMPQGGPNLDTVDQDIDGTNDEEEVRIWIDVLGAPGP